MIVTRIINKVKNIGGTIKVAFGGGVECNVCGNKVPKLGSDDWHQFVVCKRCGSQIRHRLLMAAFQFDREHDAKKIVENKTVLHFAPDKCLRPYLERSSGKYLTADFMAEGYHYENIQFNLDLCNMPSIKDNSIDLLIALDVLEHVPNDKVAMKEVYRVLVPGGVCAFTIPQKDGLEKTLEDKTVTSPEDRKKNYGQWDHLRIYGKDVVKFMQDAGFTVEVIDEKSFAANVVKKHVLFPPILSSDPLATNYRKVYFGHKK